MTASVTMRVDEPLDLPSSLTSGQCFRWRVDDQGRWTGVLSGSIVRIERTRDGLRVASSPAPPDETAHALRVYFRLGDDLPAVQQRIAWDDNVREGIADYPGMRILRQEPWETLAAFILSSTSNMPRISRTVELLATTFGEPLTLDGAVRYAFPDAAQLAEAGEARLRELGCGFRAPYLAGAAEAVADGKLALAALREADYTEALAALTALHGVGEKIADCAMLFSLEEAGGVPRGPLGAEGTARVVRPARERQVLSGARVGVEALRRGRRLREPVPLLARPPVHPPPPLHRFAMSQIDS